VVAPVVSRLLAGGPAVRVLATGRGPVGVVGEAVWRLPPLSLIPNDSQPSDAAALLADRVTAARGGLAPATSELAYLAEVADRLAGMPLAIERVAAQLRVLTAGQLAARLLVPSNPFGDWDTIEVHHGVPA
jgi:predicted ATPase